MIIKNIKGLVGVYDNPPSSPKRGEDLAVLNILENAFLKIDEGKIVDFGEMSNYQLVESDEEEIINAQERFVMPSYIDTHTHLVFAESREQEFEMKIRGASYEEIAAKGGGIINSAKKIATKNEDELIKESLERIEEINNLGTGAVEIKSGYGLSIQGELKMLRVIKKLKKLSPIPIKATFLGAHAVPPEFKADKSAYIDTIINEMLPVIAHEKLADYIDIFCEKGFYSTQDTEKILKAGAKYNLKPKIHVDQMNSLGGVEVGIQNGALSVDHLENIQEHSIKALKNSDTIATLLPSCSFYLNMKYAPARKMISEGVALSLATDFNPGSSPSGNMNFVIALACIKMKMTPEESINAATLNAAFALNMQQKQGIIAKGYKANIIITKKIKKLSYIPYYFGNNVIWRVIN